MDPLAAQFLEERGRLIPDPDRHRDVHEHASATPLARLPETFATGRASSAVSSAAARSGHGARGRPPASHLYGVFGGSSAFGTFAAQDLSVDLADPLRDAR